MNRHEMKRKLNKINDLPTLPTVALEINRMLQDEDTPIEQLVALLEKDQAMAIKILRLVNSSFYGFKSKITSLRHAVTLMGYNTIQHAVVSVAVIDSLKVITDLKAFDIARFWIHSINVAVLCRHLSARSKMADPDEAFTAGLVHDIGKVVLVNYFPKQFVALNDTTVSDTVSFDAAEKSGDTYPHNLIGSHLARRWMLPEPLDMAIRNHHGGNMRDGDGVLAGLVTVADTLVNVMEHIPGYSLGTDILPDAVRMPMIDILKESAHWFPDVKHEMADACNFFNQR